MSVGQGAATCPTPTQDTRSKLAFSGPEAKPVPQCQQISKTNTTEMYQRRTRAPQNREALSAGLLGTPGSCSRIRTVNPGVLTLGKSLHRPPPQFPCPQQMREARLFQQHFAHTPHSREFPSPPAEPGAAGNPTLRGDTAGGGSDVGPPLPVPAPAPAPNVEAPRAPRPRWPRYCFTFPGVYFC